MSKILVTGGAGYIGSHTVIELVNAGYDVTIVDNLYNSKEEAVRRVEKILGKKLDFVIADVCDKQAMREVFRTRDISAVINFAGYKAVGESVAKPIEYYENNIGGMLALIDVMREFGCKNLVFSSSATVYGNPHTVPITEDFPLSTTNPYGSTKLFIEYILKDLAKADPEFNIAILRYFNPIGAHESGLIGEDPNGIPNNLCPYITKVCVGKLEKVHVFGNDYPTPDGTGVRDYIHIVDLARGHVAALKYAANHKGTEIFNLGTGKGTSVLELVHAFEQANGIKIPYRMAERRAGDIATCYAGTEKAARMLNWRAEKTLQDMCRDGWRWQQNCGK